MTIAEDLIVNELCMKSKVSIIVPAFNEAPNLPLIYREITQMTELEPDYEFELLLMDNHSTDQTFTVAAELAKNDPRVKVIRLSRNFGFQANILSGYMGANGDVAIQIDADGEDDPMLIREFLRQWEQGYDVVYGIRVERKESWFMRLQRNIFYRLIAFLSPLEIPVDSGDFRLIDKVVLEKVLQFQESSIYLRGIISYVGYNQIGIPYNRRKRFFGESKFRWRDYMHLAIDGITSFSQRPLYMTAYAGIMLSAASFMGMLFYLAQYFSGSIPVKGFTTLILVQLLLTGIQLLCLGINGLYVGRIFEEVKKRPRSFVQVEIPKNGLNPDQIRSLANTEGGLIVRSSRSPRSEIRN